MKKCKLCNCDLIEDLSIHTYGAYKFEISKPKKVSPANRAEVFAHVCPECLEVTFSIDKKGLDILQKNKQFMQFSNEDQG